jgi:hypothetical protein
MYTTEEAVQYWLKRAEREPEPIKSMCLHHAEQDVMLLDNQQGIDRPPEVMDLIREHWREITR